MSNQSNKNQEIDLLELGAKIYLFCKRRFILILCVTLIGAIIGFTKIIPSRDYYSTRIIANSNVVSNDILIGIINSLQLILDQKDAGRLSEKLNINTDIAKSIKGISASSISIIAGEARFGIDIEVFDKLIVSDVVTGLTEYVTNQSYIKEKSLIINKQRKELVSLLDTKIALLDSTNAASNQLLIKKDIFILNGGQSSNKEMIDLFEKKQDIEKQIQLSKEIEIIEEASLITEHSTGSKKSLFIYSFIFFALGLLIAIFIEILNKIKGHLKEKNV